MLVEQLDRRADCQYPHIHSCEEARAVGLLQRYTENSQCAHIKQDMRDALVREGSRDDPIELICPDYGLIVKAVEEGHVDRITDEHLLQNEDDYVRCDANSSVESDTFAEVRALVQQRWNP